MQIQPIGNNYKAQKQKYPKFGATFVQAKPYVFKNVEDDIAVALFGVTGSSPFMKVKTTYEQILRSLVKSNHNPNSHLVYDASCDIPISSISIRTNGDIWADSSKEVQKAYYLAKKINLDDTKIEIRTANGAYVEVAIPKDGEQMPDVGAILHEKAIQKYEEDHGYKSMKDYAEAISEGKPISEITFRDHLEEQGFGIDA